MALPDVTYADYSDRGGLLDEEAFSRCLPHAVAAVRRVIGFNVPEGDLQEEAYAAAVCAAVDVDAAHGSGGGTGSGVRFSIGSFSMGGDATGATSAAYDTDMARAVRGHLVGTGLLYQGIG